MEKNVAIEGLVDATGLEGELADAGTGVSRRRSGRSTFPHSRTADGHREGKTVAAAGAGAGHPGRPPADNLKLPKLEIPVFFR